MKKVVLVDDDDPLVRMAAITIAEEVADQVHAASNAAAALKILENHSDVSVLFTDINMPGAIDGLELAELVHRRWPHIKLLVTSGNENKTDDDMPDDGKFVSKPYRDAEIETLIQDALKEMSA